MTHNFSNYGSKKYSELIRSISEDIDHISDNLPDNVKAELKEILKKSKATAPKDVYRQLKVKTIDLFAPKEEDAFEKAAQLTLTSKPSALAKQLVELLCECDPPPQRVLRSTDRRSAVEASAASAGPE